MPVRPATISSRRAIPGSRGASRGVPSLSSDSAADGPPPVGLGAVRGSPEARMPAWQMPRRAAVPNGFVPVAGAATVVAEIGQETSPRMRDSPVRFTTTRSTCSTGLAGSGGCGRP